MIVVTYQHGFKSVLIILLNIIVISCTGNPLHAPPLEGDLTININPDGIICFSPDSDSVVLGNKPYSDLEGIKDLSIKLSNDWYAKQTDKFEVVSENNQICIDDESFDFKLYGSYPNLVHGETYTLFVNGLTADGRYRVNFVGMFYYP